MRRKEIELRLAEIRKIAENPSDTDDLQALLEERNKLVTELNEIIKTEKEREELRKKIAAGLGVTIEEMDDADKVGKNNAEVRKSHEYAVAYANYIKTGRADECRKLLTENADDGTVPVPVILEERVQTAWENDQILSRVTRSTIRGNLRVPFEISGDDAIVHNEGDGAIADENLSLGVVTLIAKNIKKNLPVSDEVVAMGGEAFLEYIYDELLYRITKKLAELCVLDVVNAPAASTETAVGVVSVQLAPSVVAIPTAAANLSDEAGEVVVVMNRLTEVQFLQAHAAGNFAVDPFAGLPRVYTSALPAYNTASAGAAYAIVGDLRAIRVNFPEGDGLAIKYDDLTKKTQDMVDIFGRQYAAHGVTAPGRLVKLTKPA